MTTLKIDNFGGEFPRVPPRSLAPGAAQRYENLLATSVELRPLLDDKAIGPAAAGARSIYRLSRNSDGTLRTSDSAGWIVKPDRLNYVKGQLNDDATERTVVMRADGTQPPRVIDAKGADRVLGVPAPLKVTAEALVTDEFTRDEALVWIEDEMIPLVAKAMEKAIQETRHTGGVPTAGSQTLGGVAVDSERPWLSLFPISTAMAQANKLDSPELEGHAYNGQWALPLYNLPLWGRIVGKDAFMAQLRTLEHPKTGEQLFPEGKLGELADKLIALLDPNDTQVKAKRNALDQAVADVKAALTFDTETLPPRPVEPMVPNVPEYDDGNYSDFGD